MTTDLARIFRNLESSWSLSTVHIHSPWGGKEKRVVGTLGVSLEVAVTIRMWPVSDSWDRTGVGGGWWDSPSPGQLRTTRQTVNNKLSLPSPSLPPSYSLSHKEYMKVQLRSVGDFIWYFVEADKMRRNLSPSSAEYGGEWSVLQWVSQWEHFSPPLDLEIEH